jgi:hypothetical protein
MLEQWEADRLLRMPKTYSGSLAVDLKQGADDDYQLESSDGTAFFVLDVRRSRRNPRKARFQLRYRREIVLARLCTSVPHMNPDGVRIRFPHLHTYKENFGDKWAEEIDLQGDVASSLEFFCKKINLPAPVIQGGLT